MKILLHITAMDIYNNFIMLKDQLFAVIFSPFNRLLVLAGTSQIASMMAKVFIHFVKTRRFTPHIMASYGGMPSSHTVFISSLIFGIALDKDYGWQHPFFTFAIVISALVLIDTIRFRGTVDRLSDILKQIVTLHPHLKEEIKFPKHIAHSISEVIGGLIFSFLYTFLFYLLFYSFFPSIQ